MATNSLSFTHKRAMGVSYGAMFFEGAMNVLLVSLMPLLANRYAISPSDVSLLISAKSIGTFLMLYLSGFWSDKYGRKPVIFYGCLCMILFVLGLMLSSDFYFALVIAFLGGVGHGIMDAPSMSILFDLFPRNPAPSMSFVQVFFAGGGVFVTLLTSQILTYGEDWRLIPSLFIVVGLFLLYLIGTATYPDRPRHDSEPSRGYRNKYNKQPLFKREGVMLSACMVFFAVFQATVFTWLPTYVKAGKGLSDGISLSILSAFQIGSVMGALIFSQVLRRIHTTLLMIFNPFLALGIFTSLLMVSDVRLVFLTSFSIGIFMGIYFSLCINMGGELFVEKAGAVTGLIGTVNMLVSSITVIITGQLIKSVGIVAIYQAVPIVLIGLVVCTIIFRTMYKKLL